MKHLTIVAFVCVALVPPAVSDSVAAERESARQAGHDGATSSARRKRSVFHLFNMVTCATSCNPLAYKGYGCYCGFLGSGLVVDGIDKCCKFHDWCYEHSSCLGIEQYLAPYRWKCNGGNPYCVVTQGPLGGVNSCGHQLCECDREFVECLKQHPCPKTKAICMTSPWRYWENLFTGLSSGSGMHHHANYTSTPPPPSLSQDEKQHTLPPPSPSSSQSTPQYEEYNTVSPPPSLPSKLYKDPSPSQSSPPSALYQEPLSSHSQLLLYQNTSSSSPTSYDKSPTSPSPPSSLYEKPRPPSPSHPRLSPHGSNSFQHQHVPSAHTPNHLNETF